ncbi:hypothetical protein ON010_g16246 [Phytophthora cinnamomi]|nr:hypothetical protein ON010_g16246 [Phytophthora cinnamomi]
MNLLGLTVFTANFSLLSCAEVQAPALRPPRLLPYPAVDASGNTNKGLRPKLWAWSPRCNSAVYSTKRSRVYGRMIEYNGTWAILYSWYFPKGTAWFPLYWGHCHGWENAIVWLDRLSESATISAVSVSGVFGAYSTDTPPAPGSLDGSRAKLMYTNSYGMQHYLKTATSPGLFQDLVMWGDMTEAARSALETTCFSIFITTTVSGFFDSASVDVPMIDTNFFPNLEKAFPF